MEWKRNIAVVWRFNREQCMLMFFSLIFLAVFCEPAYIAGVWSGMHVIYKILRYALTVCVLGLFYIKRYKLNALILIGFVTFGGCLFLSTLMNEGDLYRCVTSCFNCIIILLFMQMVAEKSPTILYKALLLVLGVYVHINTITWLLYPKGLYIDPVVGYRNCWFLGYDNCAGIFIVLASLLAVYDIVSSYLNIKL